MHKVYLYRDIWKGIETCQHQKARQHFLACESEQEYSCQIWSSAGNKSFLPIFTLFTRLIHTDTSLFTASILVFSGMNGDSSFSEWVYTGWKRKSPGHEPALVIVVPSTKTFNNEGMRSASSTQPACLHLHGPTLLTLRRDRGMQAQSKKRTWTVLIYFHTLKTKALWLFAVVRLPLCNPSPCAVGMWHWLQPCCLIWRNGYVSQQQN